MFGKSIYLKLYLGFFGIFVITLILVLLLAARFYGSHLKNEVVEYSLSEARFLRDELVQNCGAVPDVLSKIAIGSVLVRRIRGS